MQNKLLIYIPKITLRHQYIFKVLFDELYFIEYSLIDNKEAYLVSEESKLNYSKTRICIDEIFIESNTLLSEKGINEIDINVQLINNQYTFFVATNENAYPFDLFAASFYLISRYEEYLPHVRDVHERFTAEQSLAYKFRFLEKPVVDIWALKLKDIFSLMESFFHGKSSGLDPLNSYLSLPILINSKTNIEPAGIPSQKEGKGAVFLLDSEQVGETEPMVNIFMNKMKNEGFRKMLNEEFAIYTDACIDNFLHGNVSSLLGNVKKLSKLVLANFKPMIPSAFHKIWEQGIQTNDYYLKLCGSGGGGYILGFAQDYDKAKVSLKKYKLELFSVYLTKSYLPKL